MSHVIVSDFGTATGSPTAAVAQQGAAFTTAVDADRRALYQGFDNVANIPENSVIDLFLVMSC